MNLIIEHFCVFQVNWFKDTAVRGLEASIQNMLVDLPDNVVDNY